MSIYEILATVLGVLGMMFVHHRWLLGYISERDKESNQELSKLIESLHKSQESLWNKYETMNERLIILNHTSMTEANVKLLLDEYRQQNKSDMSEIKVILNTLIASLDTLKTEAAINKALHQRGGHE